MLMSKQLRGFLVLCAISLFALQSLCMGDTPVPTEEKSASTSQSGMVALNPGDIAFRLYDQKITLADFQQYLSKSRAYASAKTLVSQETGTVDEIINGMDSAQQDVAKKLLTGIIRQQVLLHLAREAGITVTPEEKEAYAKRWLANNPGKDISVYYALFPQITTSPLQVSREDMFRLLKYTDTILADVEVPPAMIKEIQSQLETMKSQFEKSEAIRRKDFESYATMEGFNTDEGFAQLAKDYSDGVEKDNGGLISEPMTRKEIAECNDGQPFRTPVGQSSGLIETETSLRYIRVLEEIPSQMAGSPPKLKIAQILFAKRAMDIPSMEDIIKDQKYQMQEKKMAENIITILRSDSFECPLYPNILDDMIPKK